MRSNLSLQRKPLIISILGTIASIGLLLFLTPHAPVQEYRGSMMPVEQVEQFSAGFPVRLVIPVIDVDDFIEYVGRTPDGAMDVPKDPANVAWYMRGEKPGETGSAVIAGHSGWANGRPAAFDHLYKLKKGDKIYIEDDKGVVSTFVVRETRNYDPAADASGVFGSTDGGAHLNLITCGGVWDPVEQASPNRLVVFTDKE